MMNVSILGCGWMGRPLGRALVENGHRVCGSTTTPGKLDALHDDGIEPFHLELAPDLQGDAPAPFFDTDVLVLNVPPPARDLPPDTFPDYHRRQIASVVQHVRDGSIDWMVFASSTGVYPNVEGVPTVTENDQPPGRPEAMAGPRRATGTVLIDVEGTLMDLEDVDVTVLRFAGLYGDDRHPGRFLAGRSGVSRPEAPVNLIHRDDCVGVMKAVLADRDAARGEVFNACADAHPSRRALYTAAAQSMGLSPPTFADDESPRGKVVANAKLRQTFTYTFQHPDPLADL